jgi:membrane protein
MDSEKIKRFFVRLYEKSFDEDIFSSSAQVAFYFLFALFPLLLFLVSIFGIVLGSSGDMRHELFMYLAQVMPASAYELVSKTLDEVVEGSSGSKLTLGLLITLYSASAGIDSLGIALNAVYKLKEERPFWKRKLLIIALTLGVGVLIFIALGIIFYGSQFINLILGKIGFPISSPWLLQTLAVIIVFALLLLTFDILYYFVPNHKDTKWKWFTPGALVTIGLWLLLSKSFSIYLEYFDTYAKTYGSLGAMIILMLWLYLTALVILVGGAMNAILEEFSKGLYDKQARDAAGVNEILAGSSEERALEEHKASQSKLPPIDTEKKPVVSVVEPPAEKSTLKVIAGGIIASIIGIISYKNKR